MISRNASGNAAGEPPAPRDPPVLHSLCDHVKAQRHLARRDSVLKGLIARIGPCTLRHDPDGFSVLTRSIIAQQISTKAARAIAGRLAQALGARGVCPAA